VDVESSVPTDEELYSTVEELLREADLETITTNSVCQQVSHGCVVMGYHRFIIYAGLCRYLRGTLGRT